MAPKRYQELEDVKKDIGNLTKLYSLYTDVINQEEEWSPTLWDEIGQRTEEMSTILAGYYNRCITMQPRKLRERDAYIELKDKIEALQTVLPLLEQLGKSSIKPRHWTEVIKISNADFTPGPELKLQDLLDAHLEDYKDEIEEITEGADKQLLIETKLGEIKDRWLIEEFQFMDYPKHSPPLFILKGVPKLMEDLDEAQMNLQTLLTMKHVTPFREEVQSKLTQLSDTQETLDRWLKVQLMWCALESVFLGGDISKQLPMEAKKFSKIDKEFVKIMTKATETRVVTQCCANEYLVNTLPMLYSELEKCQKALDGYLDQKRGKFPRFYFCSSPVLLQILSQGSDPLNMQKFYEKVFDSISAVVHDPKDKTRITGFLYRKGTKTEVIDFVRPVIAKGNIEDWLYDLLKAQQETVKKLAGECAFGAMGGFRDWRSLAIFCLRTLSHLCILDMRQRLPISSRSSETSSTGSPRSLP